MKLSVLHFLMSFVAVQSLLGAVYQLRILLSLSALGPSVPNDASFLSEATGGWIPPMVWALGWSAASAAMVAGTLVVYYKSLRKPSTEIGTIPAFKAQDPAAYRAHGGS
jgi:hypothetical protein